MYKLDKEKKENYFKDVFEFEVPDERYIFPPPLEDPENSSTLNLGIKIEEEESVEEQENFRQTNAIFELMNNLFNFEDVLEGGLNNVKIQEFEEEREEREEREEMEEKNVKKEEGEVKKDQKEEKKKVRTKIEIVEKPKQQQISSNQVTKRSGKAHTGIGMKDLARKVFLLLEKKATLSYKEIDELLNAQLLREKIIKRQEGPQEVKNRRRRVYDIVNVAISMNIMAKEKRNKKNYVEFTDQNRPISRQDIEIKKKIDFLIKSDFFRLFSRKS